MKYPSLTEHFEMILSSLQGELWGEAMATTATFKMRLADLENQLKLKDEKLSEYENGIPIEKADKNKRYQVLDELGRTFDVEWWDTMSNWIINTTDHPICKKGPFYHHPFSSLESPYPLPSQTQEGS